MSVRRPAPFAAVALLAVSAAAQPHQVAPGSAGNAITLEMRNRTGRMLTALSVRASGSPAWLSVGAPRLDRSTLPPDSSATVALSFDVGAGAAAGAEGGVVVELLEGGRLQAVRTVRLRAALPGEFALLQNYPNPFNPATTIRLDLPGESLVRLAVYDILGREVERLVDEVRPAGFHSIVWRGTAGAGTQAASGVYFCRVEARATSGAGRFTAVRRMMLLR